jgi:hypothetical protein
VYDDDIIVVTHIHPKREAERKTENKRERQRGRRDVLNGSE